MNSQWYIITDNCTFCGLHYNRAIWIVDMEQHSFLYLHLDSAVCTVLLSVYKLLECCCNENPLIFCVLFVVPFPQ